MFSATALGIRGHSVENNNHNTQKALDKKGVIHPIKAMS